MQVSKSNILLPLNILSTLSLKVPNAPIRCGRSVAPKKEKKISVLTPHKTSISVVNTPYTRIRRTQTGPFPLMHTAYVFVLPEIHRPSIFYFRPAARFRPYVALQQLGLAERSSISRILSCLLLYITFGLSIVLTEYYDFKIVWFVPRTNTSQRTHLMGLVSR
ncbi:hypothetical protein F5Y19DRAFT_262103 [Xylariaceae sp. FL1651]|nr:hypothetical protein F5Y19DRAFT_262103 [Xylariaceae sp. FL1651]